VSIRRRLGAVALLVVVMVGGLMVMTAGPAAACTCVSVRSEAERMARADAVFVGELVGSRVDPSVLTREYRQREEKRIKELKERFGQSALAVRLDPVVLTFEVSRVYKGAIDERQEIVTPGGGEAACGGFGSGLRDTGPFLVYAYDLAGAMYRPRPGQYASNLCSGSRALADGEQAALERPGGPDNWPATTQLAVGVEVLAVGVARMSQSSWNFGGGP
jgi:hypothetical protein